MGSYRHEKYLGLVTLVTVAMGLKKPSDAAINRLRATRPGIKVEIQVGKRP